MAIAELGSVFHLHADFGQELNEVAAHQTGMPRGSARHKDDIVGIEQLFLVIHNATETHRVRFGVQTSAHGVAHDARLFVNLLHHEVVKASLLDGVEVHLQFLNVRDGLHVVDGLDEQVLAQLDADHLFVLDINDLLGATHNRGGIRSDEEFVVADTDDHRATLAGGDNLIGMSLLQDGDGVCAHHVVQGDTDSLQKIHLLALLHILNQVDEHLGVG